MSDNIAAARLGALGRKAKRYILTIDNTLRTVVLPAGGWKLFGDSTQVYYAVRYATSATGATLADGETAPTLAQLTNAVAGGADAGKLFLDGTLHGTPDGGCVVGSRRLGTDTTKFDDIAVPLGRFAVLYATCATTAAPVLEGPFGQ